MGFRGRDDNGREFYQDAFVLPADGAQALQLTYAPVPDSEHVYWNGLYQDQGNEWTAGTSGIVNLLAAGAGGMMPRQGDLVTVEYAPAGGVLLGQPTPVPFGSDGWSYLQVALADTVDRSSPALDDSAWPVGSAPFGQGSQTTNGWPDPVTAWPTQTRLWLRRTVTLNAGNVVTVRGRVDNLMSVFLNGHLVASAGREDLAADTLTATVPDGLIVPGDNLLAVMAKDDDLHLSGDMAYADLALEIA